MYSYIFYNYVNLTYTQRLEQFFKYTRAKYGIDFWFDSSPMAETDSLESLYPHTSEDLRIVIPSAYKISEIYYLFLIFKPTVWIFILINIFIVSIMVHWLYNMQIVDESTKAKINFSYSLLNIYKILVNNPVQFFKTANSPARMVITSWLFFYIVLSGAIMSSLIDTLINPKFYENIDTFKELYQKKGKFLMRNRIGDLRSRTRVVCNPSKFMWKFLYQRPIKMEPPQFSTLCEYPCIDTGLTFFCLCREREFTYPDQIPLQVLSGDPNEMFSSAVPR